MSCPPSTSDASCRSIVPTSRRSPLVAAIPSRPSSLVVAVSGASGSRSAGYARSAVVAARPGAPPETRADSSNAFASESWLAASAIAARPRASSNRSASPAPICRSSRRPPPPAGSSPRTAHGGRRCPRCAPPRCAPGRWPRARRCARAPVDRAAARSTTAPRASPACARGSIARNVAPGSSRARSDSIRSSPKRPRRSCGLSAGVSCASTPAHVTTLRLGQPAPARSRARRFRAHRARRRRRGRFTVWARWLQAPAQPRVPLPAGQGSRWSSDRSSRRRRRWDTRRACR